MHFSKTTLLLCISAALAGNAFAADPVIKIGVAGAHSGDLASYGLPTARAAQLVADAVKTEVDKP